jgi:hypothetical protein
MHWFSWSWGPLILICVLVIFHWKVFVWWYWRSSGLPNVVFPHRLVGVRFSPNRISILCLFSFCSKSIPWLHTRRSDNTDWSITPKEEILFPFETASSINLAASILHSSYTRLSSWVRMTSCIRWLLDGNGSSNVAFVLRRQKALTRVRSLRIPSESPFCSGLTTSWWNHVKFSAGPTRRKRRRDPKSWILFWIGVPLRHHLRSASSL